MSRHFGEAIHAGFVVPDVGAAIDRVLASGLGPVYTMSRIRTAARYRGERRDPLITSAFVYSGRAQYEFLQQHDDTPSAGREYLVRRPEGGLHHLAYYCTDFEAALRAAAGDGVTFTVVQEYITPDGHPFVAYLEPEGASDPLLVELIHPDAMSPLFDAMKVESDTWDGGRPVRDALELMPAEMRPPTEAPA
jgi:catechol 2,3-dioxygenase-like lactoylglutathione lyase family enzyme